MPTDIINSKTGLSQQEAKQRLLKFGPNTIARKNKFSPLLVFVKKFNSPLLILLIISAIISFFLGERTNAIIIFAMIFVSVVLDFYNTYRSHKAVESLSRRVAITATVIRDGEKKEVLVSEIVPGDLVFLSSGDSVPADGRLLESKDLYVNQSALTGESFPVARHAARQEDLNNQKLYAEDPSVVLMGSSVVSGFATAQIFLTGSQSQYGRLSVRMNEEDPETDFEKGIRNFGNFIMKLTFVMVLFVLLSNALIGRGLLNSFTFAIAIAIGLTPELLPIIMTVSLSKGSMAMAKRSVIVRNLSAIQNFGSMNILCTDKTGTLTEDKIKVVKCLNIEGHDDETVLFEAYLSSIFHTGVANPLDQAIEDFKKETPGHIKKIDEIPFDFERKRNSVVVEDGQTHRLITKGAPETIITVCRSVKKNGKKVKLDQATSQAIIKQYQQLSAEGYRVLAVAHKEITTTKAAYEAVDEKELTFLGFLAFLDPPKTTAAVSIRELEDLGVTIKILTGDSEVLTEKIYQDLALPPTKSLSGEQIRKMSDEQLIAKITEVGIFARVDPEQKERLVNLFKKAGHSVGYLGDGINDIAALKAADVGISVENAVDVARETADLILLKKSLEVLKDGVIEGRKTFQNTTKYILMGLSSNFGNMFSMMAGSIFLPFLPMLPGQILLNNFLYDFSQLSLSTDNVDAQDVKKPLRWDIHFIRKYMISFGPISSFFDFLTYFLLLWVFHLPQAQFQSGWFIESLSTQTMVIYIIRTKKLPFLQSRPSRLLLINVLAIVVIGYLIPNIGLGRIFGFGVLPGKVVASIILITLVYLVLVEIAKRIFYHRVKVA